MLYYLGLLIEYVWALGGNPCSVPPTPDGNIPVLEYRTVLGFGGVYFSTAP